MSRMLKDDKGQMMVIESILFAGMVLLALIFVYQLSPPSTISTDKYSNQLRILGNDALRSIDKSSPVDVYNYTSRLVELVATKNMDNLTTLLNSIIPDYVSYNVFITDGNNTVVLYDGDVLGGKIGIVARANRILVIDPNDVDTTSYPGGEIIPDNSGCLYDLILEMWYI